MENLRCEKAVEKKHNGYNCAQAVACSFCKEASMDEDTLKKITQGFGAGLGTMAGTCGAISGAAVVAGLINQDKAGTSQTVRSVMNQFKQQNGTVICKDLKGVETGKVIRSCDDCVRDAVKFLENALKSENRCPEIFTIHKYQRKRSYARIMCIASFMISLINAPSSQLILYL